MRETLWIAAGHTFEDDGGRGIPVVFHGGFGEPIDLVRGSPIVRAVPAGEFRHVYVDHRGHGRSDKPHDSKAYALPLRVADVMAVLDELGIERAHFVGASRGGRLGFGIGEHAPERVLSLVIGGQQPYGWPDSPLVRAVSEGLATAREEGSIEPFVGALEEFWGIRFPEERRTLDNDPDALSAAWQAALTEGPVSQDLGAWRVPCLIFIGAADVDFLEQARRAATEIPNAEFISLVDSDHYRAHTRPEEAVIEAVLRVLHGSGRRVLANHFGSQACTSNSTAPSSARASDAAQPERPPRDTRVTPPRRTHSSPRDQYVIPFTSRDECVSDPGGSLASMTACVARCRCRRDLRV
jgi:pimeloyl-ACP methyl ester carboxylesterase